MRKIITYLKARLGERSTIVGAGAAVAAGAAFDGWMRKAIIAMGLVAVLYPEPKKDRQDAGPNPPPA